MRWYFGGWGWGGRMCEVGVKDRLPSSGLRERLEVGGIVLLLQVVVVWSCVVKNSWVKRCVMYGMWDGGLWAGSGAAGDINERCGEGLFST